MSKILPLNQSSGIQLPPPLIDKEPNHNVVPVVPVSSLIDYSSPTRKTRLVRVRRNSMGVEIGRSYADTKPEVISNSDDIKNRQIERIPLSPLKPSLMHQRRSSLDASLGSAYDYKADINSDSKITTLLSPSINKIVRVRRNSLGVAIGRSYSDETTNVDFNNSAGSNSNDTVQLPTSPSKTRFVRIQRNSLGVEIGRSYVDAPKTKQDFTVVNSNSNSITNDAITSARLSPNTSLGQSRSSMFSPGKISSPRKVASQRMKSLSRNVHMKAMEQSASDFSTLDLFLPPIDGDNGHTGSSNVEEALLQKKNFRSATTNQNDGVPPISPATARKVKSLKARLPTKTTDGGSNHFVTSPSLRSRSMRMYPGTDITPNADDHQAQSLRLLRVLLGEDSAIMSKENVDKALEKHAELLRFQLQQKKKIKQRDDTIQQEKKQQEEMMEEHKRQIVKLNDDVQKQKMLMKTSLEIKDVEIGILTKENEQKTVKVQQLAWRLAKERAAAKESRCNDSVISLASSEGQLSDSKEDSNSLLDLLNIMEQPKELDDDDISEATPIAGHTSFSNFPSPNKSKKPSSKDKEDDESSSPMKVGPLKKKLDQTEGQLLIAKKSILQLEKKQQEMELDFEETLHESKSKVTQLKVVLTACNERRRVAEQMLRDLGKFDEATLMKISRKPPKELMSDISEQGIAMKVGALTTSESENSSSARKEHVTLEKEVQSLRDQLNDAKSRSFKLEVDNAMNVKEVQATKEANERLEIQLTSIQMKLKDYEVQLTAAKTRNAEKLQATATSLREIEKVTAECSAANETNKIKMESQLQSLQQELDESRQKYAELQTELSLKVDDYVHAMKAAEERFAKLEAELLQATENKKKAECDMEQHQVELDEARLLLQQSESMIEKYATRLQETNTTVKQCEEKIAKLNEQAECKQSESASNTKSQCGEVLAASVAEIHAMLLETQVQVKEYETKLEQVQLALQESEAMAEKYLSMLEEANATLEQSEKLMRQYDRMQPNLLMHGESSIDNSELASGESESEGSEDLSMKSTQDLLAYASRRLNGIPLRTQNCDDTSNVIDDDVSSSQSTAFQKRETEQSKASGAFQYKSSTGEHHESSEVSSVTSTNVGEMYNSGNSLLQNWEKSRLQNASISKIATLETELAERQIQLTDALHKIADLTRNSDVTTIGTPTTVSGVADSCNGDTYTDSELTKALVEVTELKERVAMAEEKYHDATKKLIFLKETVLTVVDTEMSILK